MSKFTTEQNQKPEDCCEMCRFWEDLHRGNGYGKCEIKSTGKLHQLMHKSDKCENSLK